MTNNTKQAKMRCLLDKLADEFRRVFDIQTPITDIDAVIQKIGGEIQVKDHNRYYDYYVTKTSDEHFVITLKNKHEIDQIMQGIGILVLFMGLHCDEQKWNRQPINIPISPEDVPEYENIQYLALALLMPKEEYTQVLYKNLEKQYVNTSEIAKYFNINANLAWLRGYKLGMLEWF